MRDIYERFRIQNPEIMAIVESHSKPILSRPDGSQWPAI